MSKREPDQRRSPLSRDIPRARCPGRDAPDYWPRLGRQGRVALIATMVVIAITALPYLPPGVCEGDAGDLQLASATLGVMHPPGYPAYVSLGYLITRIPKVDPAYLISLACLGSGLIALALCMLVQMRLGVNPWIAAAACLVLTCHPRVWVNLIEPEVYAPSLALLLGSAYLLIRYARLGNRTSVYVAAFLFGLTVANRPNVIWMLPFFCFSWWLARKRWDSSARDSFNVFVRVTLLAIVPGLYSLGYIAVRDTPETQYNYIESYNAEFGELPDADAGWKAKIERLAWQVSAAEFRRYLPESVRDMRMRLRWLYLEFFLYRIVSFLGSTFVTGPFLVPMAAILVVLGGTQIYRRCRSSFWLVTGMIASNIVFICSYRIYGLAADLLPLMSSGTVIIGVAVSTVFPSRAGALRRAFAVILAVFVGIMMVLDAPYRSDRESLDAVPFLTELDMQTLPQDAVICSTWRKSPPLWYAQCILTKRPDIEVVNVARARWYPRIVPFLGRPIFVIDKAATLRGQRLTPYRNIWRWEDPQPFHR